MTRPEPAAEVPSVLVLLVVKDGAPWLRECLQALAAQTYPRLGVLAIDNGSRDGSRELLEQALGPGRVLALGEDLGVAGSIQAALERIPAAAEVDFLLVLHDDAVLSPDAVERMVEAATLEGVERIGVVGPKVLDWDDPRVLREVGRAADRFGHPASPLQDGEVDHGQYDRVREVLFVSSVAMLVSREAWRRTGPPDERLASYHEDLDFCWRARVAGFRVLFTPLATVRHRGAAGRGERPVARRRTDRYYAERAGLAAMLKNYAVPSLAWLLPLSALFAVLRVAALALSRRLEDALDIVAAWMWNLRHLPGTIRRRVRAQAVRRVRDREVLRFMEPALLRMPRWLEAAGRIIAEQQELDVGEAAPARVHAASLARAHPVLVASVLATCVGGLAVRAFLGREVLEGGVLPAFP
ncbi:MAG TPA: glycosyltransferase family 2 protein, partial [Actinomycetota bacterium]|nr:glycosyltransferase family 2 protein [Actinomycetota bacterium]